MKVSLTLTLVASVYTSLATAYTVTLPYITVTPDPDLRNSSGTPLAKPLLAYYSIPYVAPPTGENRFRPPQDPVPDQGYSNLTNYGPVCPQPLNPAFPVQAEDCLTLSVFRPRDVDSTKKLPVVVWVPGGAFNTGGGRGLNVPSLVGNAPQDMVAVSINYRIGALGGIPSSAGKAAGAVNLGLLDQAAAFKWVQQYISRFGGDPKQVTLFGESAGAHSVGAHLQHTWPKNERPFDKVIMDSGGPAARAWPDYTYPLYEQQSQEFFNMTGCNRGGNATWDCLRTADLGTIVNASTTLYAKYSSPVRWPFQPVVDYAYVNQAPSVSWSKGQFERVPILTGFNTDEGTVFVPRSVQNATQFRQYFQTLLIANDTILNEIEQLYPDPATNPGSPYQNSSFSPQWSRLAAAYGDYAYISTVRGSALAIAGARDKKAPVWKYHFNRITTTVPDNKPLGVAHASELVSLVQVDKSETSTKMTAYYTSFIVSGDPNALTPKNYTSWPKYTIEDQKQIAFNQDSVVVQKDDLRTEQQDFWLSNPQIFPH